MRSRIIAKLSITVLAPQPELPENISPLNCITEQHPDHQGIRSHGLIGSPMEVLSGIIPMNTRNGGIRYGDEHHQMLPDQGMIPPTQFGGQIAAVEPGSIAEQLGLQPGDQIVAINGVPLRDIIDYRFALADDHITMTVWSNHELVIYEIEKDPDEDLGIRFAEPLFTPIRLCRNHCIFCFVRQMPMGLRPSLYVRDDDYRLSFLYGNFITLTNLDACDWQRIEEQHLSPLYLSVHTTDRGLRAALMGRREIPDILSQIRRLGEIGVQVHTQIVVCPGWNDGMVLRRTIEDLANCFPIVQSIAVVPVGLTRYYRPDLSPIPLRGFTRSEARTLVDTVRAYACRYRKRLGVHLVYPADELLLLGRCPIPPARFYDGYPQYANGVGMIRDFLDEWARARKFLPDRAVKEQRITFVSGALFAPILERLLNTTTISGLTMQVVPVPNQFFGATVTVSGLMTGQDVVAQLTTSSSDLVVLPRSMFDHTGTQTLDGYHRHELERNIGRPTAVIGTAYELLQYLQRLAAPSSPPSPRRAVRQERATSRKQVEQRGKDEQS